ncbi:alternative ribosome rescue aminoacyl-tRNA hydrolase ArfB [Chloroflexota bacterium]
MIQVTDEITIDESEIQQDFIRSSGPGGQNVNKVATAVQVRFDVRNSRSLPEDVRERLTSLASKRMTEDGQIIIEAKRFRTQERNRHDGINRLVSLVRRAAEKPKSRIASMPTKASNQRRLEAKRRRAKAKNLRASVQNFDD